MKDINIGVSGPHGAGKDTVVDILNRDFGFEPVTSSDVLRDYIRDHGLGEPTRPLLGQVARNLRKKDPATIIRQTIERCRTGRIAVSGIYTVAEATYFTETAGGVIVSCNADMDVRYQRAIERGRVGDDIDLDTFVAWENERAQAINPEDEDILAVDMLASVTITNNASLTQLRARVQEYLSNLGAL